MIREEAARRTEVPGGFPILGPRREA